MGTRLRDLGVEVSASLENARGARSGAANVREKLVTRETPRLRAEWQRTRSRTIAFGSGIAVAAAVVVTAFFAWPRHDEPLVLATKDPTPPPLSFVVGDTTRGKVGEFISAPAATETPLTFSDGSELRLAPAASLRVSEVTRNGAHVLVESGTVHVSVMHRPDTHWSLEAGPFAVDVTGTKFDLTWDPAAASFRIKMHEGSVRLHGCGHEERRLSGEEEALLGCKGPVRVATPSDLPPAPPPLAQKTDTAKIDPPKIEAPKVARPDPATDVVTLAKRGAHADALAAAEATGFDATCDRLSAGDLLLLADAARYAGKFDRATQALDVARRRFTGTEAAATAAFELGRIAMDVRHDLPAAGDHFETYLRERPAGTLSREALGRALEARHRSGDSERAERLAVRYLSTYPDGPHAKLARRLSEP
jgi:hypothetical protein